MAKNFNDTFSRFLIISECDRQTRTDRRDCYRYPGPNQGLLGPT